MFYFGETRARCWWHNQSWIFVMSSCCLSVLSFWYCFVLHVERQHTKQKLSAEASRLNSVNIVLHCIMCVVTLIAGGEGRTMRQHCWPCLITHLTCRIQSLHAATKVNPCEAHKRVKHRISKTDLGGKTQCGHWDTLLESTSSSSDLFKDFYAWQSSKLTEGNLSDSGHFLLLTLLLAEMQWWMRTLTKELIYVFMIVALNSRLEYWCQARSYQQRTNTELKKWNTRSNIK